MKIKEIIKTNAMALVAFMIAAGSFGLMSFAEQESKEPTILKFRYNLSAPAGIEDSSNWTDVSHETNPQGCQQQQLLACLVEFSDEEYADLDEFLDEYDSNSTIMGSGYVTATKPIQ